MINIIKILSISILFQCVSNLRISDNFLRVKKVSNIDKFISLHPAGINGFYTLGIVSYLLDNYDTKKFKFIGASSGSWNSLICTYKYNHTKMIEKLLAQNFFDNPKAIYNIQEGMYNHFLDNYQTNDFRLDKLHISLSEFKKNKLNSIVINNFSSLNEALTCCISSSHIPFLTSNKLINNYNGLIVFDGGFTLFPPTEINNYFTISSMTFDYSEINSAICGILSKNVSKKIIKDLYCRGYEDSKNNKDKLDRYFI